MKFYQYPACSTCKKAKKWLEGAGHEVESVHIVESPPSLAQIKDAWQRSGLDLKRFFNTSGQSYRALNLKERYTTLDDEARLALLAADGKLLKRPLLVGEEGVLVGFNQGAYEAFFLTQDTPR